MESGGTIDLRNEGEVEHNFAVTDQDISEDVDAGDLVTVTIDLDAGTYAFFCEYHPEQMTGRPDGYLARPAPSGREIQHREGGRTYDFGTLPQPRGRRMISHSLAPSSAPASRLVVEGASPAAPLGRDLGIDLGTANTVIVVRGKGVVLTQPSYVAIDREEGRIIAIGSEAKEMVGRVPDHIEVIGRCGRG